MPVAGYRQGQLREHPLERVPLVAELVAGIDGQCGHEPEREHDGQDLPEALRDDHRVPDAGHQDADVDRDRQVGQPAIVGIALHLDRDLLGRVVRVGADEPVEQRNQAVDDHQRRPQQPAPTDGLCRGNRQDRQHGDEDRQHPARPPAIGVLQDFAARSRVGISLHWLPPERRSPDGRDPRAVIISPIVHPEQGARRFGAALDRPFRRHGPPGARCRRGERPTPGACL